MKAILEDVLVCIYKFFHFMKWKLRLYLAWSRAYRFLRNRSEYDKLVKKIPLMSSYRAQKNMDLVEWKKDNWKALWDALDSPKRFHYFVQMNTYSSYKDSGIQPKDCNDCDEYAYYAACVVPGSYYLNICWIDKKTLKYEGHNVCVCSKKSDSDIKYFHIGNWGASGEFDSLKDLVLNITSGNRLIGWAVMNYKRKVLLQSRSELPGSNEENIMFNNMYK